MTKKSETTVTVVEQPATAAAEPTSEQAAPAPYATWSAPGMFVPGVPARDISQAEWEALDEGVRHGLVANEYATLSNSRAHKAAVKAAEQAQAEKKESES